MYSDIERRRSMRRLVKLMIFLLALAFGVGSEAKESSPLKRVFSRPLIIGASVSSGFLSDGPGTLATRWITGSDTSVNVSKFGAKGKEFRSVSRASLSDYSMVIAIDFVFWDSTSADVRASRAAVRRLIRSARAARIPLVLGDVPQLLKSQLESSRHALNQTIHAECRPDRQCYLIGLDELHRGAVSRGLVIDGHLYFFKDLTLDGLHLNSTGSGYVARKIISRMTGLLERL